MHDELIPESLTRAQAHTRQGTLTTLHNTMSAIKSISMHSAAKRMMSGSARSRPVLKTMLPKGTFDGKIALVTGGGTGLGKGIATKLSDLGATVAIMSRKRGVVDVAAKEIEAITGNPVIALTGDVRDPEQVKAALDELDEKAGIPTIVVNNAYVTAAMRELSLCVWLLYIS